MHVTPCHSQRGFDDRLEPEVLVKRDIDSRRRFKDALFAEPVEVCHHLVQESAGVSLALQLGIDC
jgi:hypothetical protein